MNLIGCRTKDGAAQQLRYVPSTSSCELKASTMVPMLRKDSIAQMAAYRDASTGLQPITTPWSPGAAVLPLKIKPAIQTGLTAAAAAVKAGVVQLLFIVISPRVV